MPEEIDTITWGETYDVSVTALDADDAEIAMDGTWSCAMVVAAKLGGPAIITPPIAIIDGKAEVSIDTGEEPWKPGRYIYDIRLTDADGNDQWTAPVVLVLEPRNSPNT